MAQGEKSEKKIALPHEFKVRMTALLGEDEASRLFNSIEEKSAVKAFRVNKLKTDPESFEAAEPEIDRKRVDFPPCAYLTAEEFPGSIPCHHSGAIYMQDISAMSTVHAVEDIEGACVLDSCSAPGGKTTQLAAMVGRGGIVVANEYEQKRARILRSNVERMGAENVVVCNLDTAVLAQFYPEKFDLVLCDAPCSGEGMFRKNERAVTEWSLENVKMCRDRQREILSNVVKCVKKGGRLLYSTCTFSLEENEENVAWFLNEYKDFELVEVSEELKAATSNGISLGDGADGDIDMSKCRRIYPHLSLGEGQFIALLKRRDGCGEDAVTADNLPKKDKRGSENGQNKKNRAELDAHMLAREFLRENLVNIPDGELVSLGNTIYLAPSIELPEYNVLGAGVALGECQKGRILPHHHLFSALGKDFKLKIMLSGRSEEAKRYLCGEEISVDGCLEANDEKSNGWAAVMIDGCPVGGAKVSGGVAKNHYPKGLRNGNYKQ